MTNWKLIQEGYFSGKSTSQLANEFNLSQTGIAKGLRRMGTVMRASKPYKRHSVDHTVFSSPLSHEAEYWLGILMTDGCVFYPKGGNFLPKISLELQARDKAHVQRFSDFIKSTYPLYYNKSANAWKAQVASQELAETLADFGIFPRKTHTVEAPETLIASRHFWRGVLDGDGYIVCRRASEYELAGASTAFLKQFIDFVYRETGNGPSITKNGHGCPRVRSSSNSLLLYLYQPGDVALDRKMEIIDQIRRSTNQSISSVSTNADILLNGSQVTTV